MKKLLADPLALVSTLLAFVLIILAALAPVVSPYPMGGIFPDDVLLSPNAAHWFGTDRLGRDLLTRVLYGSRVSVAVGLLAAILSTALGFFYGALAGLARPRIEGAMMRLVDILYGLPELLLIILFSLVFEKGVVSIALALALVGWMRVARLVRGEVLRIKTQSYYESARAMGIGLWRKIFRYVLPNVLGVLLVALTLQIPISILTESVLSFIGLGIDDPYSSWGTSWGTLARSGWQGLRSYPHLLFFPSAAIFLSALAFNFLGDFLRDRLEPSGRF
ncbi:MAG: ABC transporter permease [Bdellovibrionota bacterium]